MRPILSLSAASGFDHDLINRYGLSESALIDNAAKGVFDLTWKMISDPVLVMAGPGNNGSDGLALATLLSDAGFDCSVLFLYEKGNAENLRRRKLLPPSVSVVSDASGYSTVYDALFGFGFHGDADDRTRSVISKANEAETVISIDVPSASLVKADVTVSLMALKDVLFEPSLRSNAGRILFCNPGFPESCIAEYRSDINLITDEDSGIIGFDSGAYKNTRGHLAVIGGSDRYTGAPRLAARAAFFSGAGLVTIVTDSERIRDENPAVIIAHPGADLSTYDALVVGPGWGEGSDAEFSAAAESGKNLVVDADALKFVPGHSLSGRAVLTPHIGEYRKLMAALGIPDGLGNPETLSSSIRRLSIKTGAVVVLKSSVVWITDGSRIFVYDGSNPSLGVAGSGDVLSGIIGALLAAGEAPLDAARDGVILHQRAGRSAHERYGYYSAEELILETGRCR